MKKIFGLFSICLFAMTVLQAQQGCEIRLLLKNYSNDTIWFGQTYGKRNVPDFFGLRQSDGSYLLKTDKPLDAGMYAIIYKRTPTSTRSFQCWLANGERSFTIETILSNPYHGTITGSRENELLFSYNYNFRAADRRLDEIIERWRYAPNEETYQKRVALENEMHQYQKDFIAKNPGSITAKLVRQTMLPVPPPNIIKAKEWEAAATERWLWQRQHYFDDMDISTAGFMRYKQWLEHVDFYIFHLPPQNPDTTIALINQVMGKLETNPGAYQYYNKYLTRSLARMSKYRLDEVYAHVLRNYMQTDKATWASDSQKRKYISDADRLESIFEGQKGPDLTLYKKDNSPVSLYQISAPYTLMIYWMPDCGHCKKEIPVIMKAYDRYKGKGLQVLSVCGKPGNSVNMCWDYVDENKFPEEWFIVADPQRRSKITSLYNIRSYPRVIIFDKDKNIVFKRSGSMRDWQLEAVLGGLDW